jgi:hypothetical protein
MPTYEILLLTIPLALGVAASWALLALAASEVVLGVALGASGVVVGVALSASGVMLGVAPAASEVVFGVAPGASGVMLGVALGVTLGAELAGSSVVDTVNCVGAGGVGLGEEAEGFSDRQPSKKREAARETRIRIAENSPGRQREKQLFSACEEVRFRPCYQW